MQLVLQTVTSVWSSLGKTKFSFKNTNNEHLSSLNLQNFLVVWLDRNIDIVNNNDSRHTINELKKLINNIKTFTNSDECLAFMTHITNEKIFLIISGKLGETFVPIIHNMSQIDSIFIFCYDELKHRQWAKNWLKIKGVFRQIVPICKELKQAVIACEHNAIQISLISCNEQLAYQQFDQINQTFMYTQILKDILLSIESKELTKKDFIDFCRLQFADNPMELHNVNRLDQEYNPNRAIWWYTYECFLYSMINRALRTMEIDIIINMGFFLRDLHENIKKLYIEQYINHHKRHPFTVYRGQGITKNEFEQLLKTKDGLLSFNNFLSTSRKADVGLNFARRSIANSDLIGVLFTMFIDPSLTSTPFASIKTFSYFQTEREILFSMHSVFRIGTIKPIEPHNKRLWQVELILTSDDDPHRAELTRRIFNELPGLTGWHRLAQFLIMMARYDKAEDLYKTLLDKPHDQDEKAQFYHHLGVIKDGKGEYEAAIQFYEASLGINRQILSPDHHYLASTYTGIGLVYSKIGDHTKALDSHRQALSIFQKTLMSNHQLIAKSYGNIGKVYDEMGDYAQALSSHQKALSIFQQVLLPIHPSLAVCYHDIGKVYDKMHDLKQALSSHEKALDIRVKTLPSSHPLLASSYDIVGELYIKIGDSSKGVLCIKRALNIAQNSLSESHPDRQRYINTLKQFQTDSV